MLGLIYVGLITETKYSLKTKKKRKDWQKDTWLAQLVDHATLDLSQGGECKPHTGHRDYFKKRKDWAPGWLIC